MSEIALEALEHALTGLGLQQGGCEYHGALCGMICSGAPLSIDLGLAEPGQLATGVAAEGAVSLLTDLTADAERALGAADLGFSPMLPDDDESLAARAAALADWCQGFLFGLANRPGLDLEQLSEDAREMLGDLTHISQASAETDGEVDEAAYAELVEYVRVGAQMLYYEFRTGDDDEQASTLH